MRDEPSPPVGPFTLPPPRFADDAFAPTLSADTVRAQRTWRQAQVDAVNVALAAAPSWQGLTIEALLRRMPEMPPALGQVVATHGAGHANHQFLWKVLRPAPAPEPSPTLRALLEREFGTLDALRARFEQAAPGLGGDGWALLVINARRERRLEVVALPGDASVLPLGLPGLLVCDLWRHAWAPDHPDLRSWLASFWTMVDWEVVENRYTRLLQGVTQL